MRRFPFHPFLLAPLPLLFLFIRNHGQILAGELIEPVLLIWLGVVVGMGTLYAIRRDQHFAAAIVALTAIVLLWYAPIHSIAESALGDLARHRYVLALLAAAVVAAAIALGRRPAAARAITRPANLFSVILLAMLGLQLAAAEWERYRAVRDVGPRFAAIWEAEAGGAPDSAGQRGIYYIVLDAYAREDVLRELYDFDNSAFTEAIRSRGFLVSPAGRSNYSQTFLSLASSLNGIHLTPLADLEGGSRTRSTDRIIPFRLIRENRVMRVLRDRGYSTLNIASGWGPTDIMPRVDRTIRCGPSEFTEMLLRQTAAWPLVAGRMKDDVHELRLCQLQSLADAAHLPGPKFVLAHIVLPHPPFVFGPEGQRVEGALTALGDDAPWQQKALYVDQLRFASDAILAVLDTIIAREEPDPIIVLQSDHGPASSSTGTWSAANDALVRERMSILNAVRAPGLDSLRAEDILTPVATFPLLLEAYFEIRWERAPHESYFSTSEQPFVFTPVDSLLASPSPNPPDA